MAWPLGPIEVRSFALSPYQPQCHPAPRVFHLDMYHLERSSPQVGIRTHKTLFFWQSLVFKSQHAGVDVAYQVPVSFFSLGRSLQIEKFQPGLQSSRILQLPSQLRGSGFFRTDQRWLFCLSWRSSRIFSKASRASWGFAPKPETNPNYYRGLNNDHYSF